jgi:hypothetical protein
MIKLLSAEIATPQPSPSVWFAKSRRMVPVAASIVAMRPLVFLTAKYRPDGAKAT